jgi:predicted transcriptional regulator
MKSESAMKFNSDSNSTRNSHDPRKEAHLSDHLLALAGRITSRMVMTPREQLVCAQPNTPIERAIDLLRGLFDQLPVLDGDRFVGLAFRHDLVNISSANTLMDAVVPVERLPRMLPDAPMREAFTALISDPCVVLLEGEPPGLVGLIHFSDLNRHPVRSNAYLWLSAFEMMLAELVRRHAPDPIEWLKVLDEHRQMMILGRWAYDQRQNIEIDPVEAAELSDLLRAVRTLPGLLEGLGYTRSRFDKKTGHLVRLRNGVMHPVRSIIRRHEDVRQLAAAYADIRELLDAIRRMLTTPLGAGCPNSTET